MAAATAEAGKQGGSITRQTSIYSLTLDELQNTLGEPGRNFGSMNMDEFLKNIWTVEESQAMAAAIGSDGPGLFRQPSVRQPLPRTLSQKTVDEVWKDIHRPGVDVENGRQQQRQATLGEMTLEDFLVKAGVMRDEEASLAANGGNIVKTGGGDEVGEDGSVAALSLAQATPVPMDAMAGNQQDWLANPYGNAAAMAAIAQQQQHQHQQQFLQQQAVEVAAYMNAAKGMSNGGGGMTALGQAGLGLGPSSMGMNGMGFTPASPPSPGSDSQGNGYGMTSGGFGLEGRGRKRGLEGPVEVVLERRQRRMIKNRESAARSRARKQAYTVELEAEVTHLKEENMKLKKLQEEAEQRDKKRAQMLEHIVAAKNQVANSLPKPTALRRTLTGPW